MEKIKLDFIGFWSNFDKQDNIFTNILKERYSVEISEKPDFLIASPLCHPYEYLKYDCVRILFTGEPLSPDFNIFDYAIAFDNMVCLDGEGFNRYYRYPLCFFNVDKVKKATRGLTRNEAEEALRQKKYFCNFIYGHRSSLGQREKMFEIFSQYKRIESPGKFMNNMPNGEIIPYSEKKMDFLKLCKFTIACESVSYPGFITEKIMDPLACKSVPIYYGNPLSANEFNMDAMIDCRAYPDFEAALERIIEVDSDDEQYIKMLMQPKLISNDYIDKMYNGLKEFLWHIFSFSGDDAYRRCRFYISKHHEDYLKDYNGFSKSIWYKAYKKLNK